MTMCAGSARRQRTGEAQRGDATAAAADTVRSAGPVQPNADFDNLEAAVLLNFSRTFVDLMKCRSNPFVWTKQDAVVG